MEKSFLNQNDNDVKIKEVNKEENNYKFIEINNGRIFTDYIEHVAVINKNQIRLCVLSTGKGGI